MSKTNPDDVVRELLNEIECLLLYTNMDIPVKPSHILLLESLISFIKKDNEVVDEELGDFLYRRAAELWSKNW